MTLTQISLKGMPVHRIDVWWDTDSGRDNEGWAIHVYGDEKSELFSGGISADADEDLDSVIDQGLWNAGVVGLTHDDFAKIKDNGGFAQWMPNEGTNANDNPNQTGETKMTKEQAILILGDEVANVAISEGTAWGEQEAEVWRDQHPSRDLPNWTPGKYAGKLPFPNDDTKRDAYETLLDLAAKDAWNNS